MEKTVYIDEAGVEAEHWWFVGRRRLISRVISQLQIHRSAKVLDVGTGTGTNLRLLVQLGFTEIEGLDFNEDAINFCKHKGLGMVRQGDACAMPFPDKSFDLILATDIIEHLDDDLRALSEIHRVLKPGGKCIILVPAFMLLWGFQDERCHHKRRYTLNRLLRVVNASGLTSVNHHYFNYILFFPILLARKIIKLGNLKVKNETQINTKFLNSILTWIFTFDIKTSPLLCPPIGVSIFVIAIRES
jgi:SAM-dependent methyltransferase